MIDLNSVIPANSLLKLIIAFGINDRGEIAGEGVPPGVPAAKYSSQGHAFLLIPCDEDHGDSECEDEGERTAVARGAASQRPNVVLPESVRKLLQRRLGSRYHIPGIVASPRD
jgi:hypothetical protein